ncbi:MAG: c-type cytochrome [Halioglobus sp.]
MLIPTIGRRKLLGLLSLMVVLSGCVEEPGEAQKTLEAASRTMQPADPQLAEIYNRSCRSCHTIAATGSPLTGDVQQWSVRLEKGMDTLVDNAVSGFGGMPPFGMCMDCEVEDFEALINFMSQPLTPESAPDA